MMKQLIDSEAEINALGSAISYQRSLDAVFTHLSEKDFTTASFCLIFDALKKLDELNKPITQRNVTGMLKHNGMLPELANEIVFQVTSSFCTPEMLDVYIKRIKTASYARKLIASVDEAKKEIEHGEPIEKVAAKISAVIEGLETVEDEFECDMRDGIDQAADRAKQRHKGTLKDVGMPTGIAEIDKIVTFRKGELIIVAARPGGGKSVMLNQIRINSVSMGGYRTGFINLEMSKEQMSERSLATITKTGLNFIQGQDPMEESKIDALPLKVTGISRGQNPECYRPDMTIQSIRTMARRWKRKHDIDVLFVDYIQLIESMNSKGKQRSEVVSEISRGLKKMAKELDIPVIAAAQLNRASEDSERPALRHLRESGSIEQDADIVIILHEESNKDGTTGNVAIVAKNRSGKCGVAPICFLKHFQSMN